MLSRNSITIAGSKQYIDEIYAKMNPASVAEDVANYHKYCSDRSMFLSIFFDGISTSYEDFGIEWAYVESCDRTGDSLSIVIYSFNGNLFLWKKAFSEKYKESDIAISMTIDKSVKFKSY